MSEIKLPPMVSRLLNDGDAVRVDLYAGRAVRETGSDTFTLDDHAGGNGGPPEDAVAGNGVPTANDDGDADG